MSKKGKGGRRGKYMDWLTHEGLVKLEGWARDGLTNEQIAKNVGINPDTLYTWMKKYSEIAEALKKGKEVVDREVEKAMLQNILGYSYDEDTFVSIPLTQEEYDLKVEIDLAVWDEKNPDASENERDQFILSIPRTKQVLEKKVTKFVKPDTTAQIFWLKNRKPDKWRDRKELDANVNHTANPYSELTTDELKKLIDLEE